MTQGTLLAVLAAVTLPGTMQPSGPRAAARRDGTDKVQSRPRPASRARPAPRVRPAHPTPRVRPAHPAPRPREPVARPRAATSPKAGSPVHMTGTPLADAGMKDGTVSVRVVGSSFRDNLENVQVDLYRLDAFEPLAKGASKLNLRPSARPVLQARTGAGGRALLDASRLTGQRVRLMVTHKAMVQASRAFAVPASGGLRFIFSFRMGGAGAARKPGYGISMPPGHPGTAMEPGVPGEPVVSVEYRIATAEAGKLTLMVVYIFWNGRKRPLQLASGGVLLPHPVGLKNVGKGPQNPHAKLSKKGLTVFGQVPPGRMEVSISGVMKHDEDSLRMRHRIPIRLRSFGIISRVYPKVRFLGPNLKPASLNDPEAAERYKAVRGPGGPPGTTIEFNISGLPFRSKFWSKAAVALAVLLVLAAVARTLLARFKADKPVEQKPASAE